MKETIYLVVSKKGVKTTLYKNPPSLKPGELWIQWDLSLPDVAFTVPPIRTSLTLTEDQIRNKKIEGFELELKRLKESD